jgi:hypothetical protein
MGASHKRLGCVQRRSIQNGALVPHRLLQSWRTTGTSWPRKPMMMSIAPGRASLLPVQAKSLRPHALYLVVKRFLRHRRPLI